MEGRASRAPLSSHHVGRKRWTDGRTDTARPYSLTYDHHIPPFSSLALALQGYKLFVGNLSFRTQSAALRDAFEPFGRIVFSTVIENRETGQSRCVHSPLPSLVCLCCVWYSLG